MKRAQKILTIFIVLMPILNSYTTPFGKTIGLSIVQLLFPFFLLVFFVREKKLRMDIPYFFLLFCIYIFIAQILFASSLNPTELISISLFAFIIVFGYVLRNFDFNLFCKVYKVVIVVCMVVFVFQEFTFLIYGQRLDGIIEGIPLMANTESGLSYVEKLRGAPRSSSIFLEPSHFAEYIFPLLAIELFRNNSLRISIWAIIASLLLIFLRSGNGIIGLSVLWSIWFFSRMKNNRKMVMYLFVLIPVFAILVRYYLFSDYGQEMIGRSENINDSHSSYMRIFRGYIVYDSLPVINQIFGMNAKNLSSYIQSGSIANLFGEGDTYFNTTQYILLISGIIGYLFYLLFILKTYKRTEAVGKALIILFFVFSFTTSNYLSISMLFYFVIIYRSISKYDENVIKYCKQYNSALFNIRVLK